MAGYTKLLQFSKETAEKIYDRDYGTCLFCNMEFHMESTTQLGYEIKDIMHYIPKSQRGLGIEQNGVIGCRYHHSLMDNGNKGLRQQMQDIMQEHLKTHYPDWNENDLIYKKWR